MAVEEVLIKFVSDTDGLTDSIDKLVRMGKVTEEDAKKFNALGDAVQDGINDALKEAGVSMKQFGDELFKATKGAEGKFKSLRTQVIEANNAAVQAGRNFGLSSEEYLNAANKAALLKAELKDLNATLEALDPDTKAKAFVQFGGAALGAFQIATGALQAFGVENEKVNKLAQQFQGFINVAQGISQLGELGDALKNIRTVLGITETAQKGMAAATVATTAAVEAETVATEQAAVATKGFTASLVTSPLVIFAAAAAAIAVAIIAIDEANERAARSAELLKKRMDDIAASQSTFDEAFEQAQARMIRAKQQQVDLAQAQGQTQSQIIALEIEKQNAIIASADAAIKTGKGTIEAEKELVAQRQEAVRQLEVLNAQLTKSQKDEADKRTKEEESAALKQIEIQRQLLVEKQKLALVNVTDPSANLQQQINNLIELYQFDLDHLKETNQNKELLTAQHLTQLETLRKQSADRIFADVLKEQEREADAIDKKNKEALKNQEALFTEAQRRRILLATTPVEVAQIELQNLEERYRQEIENAERTGKDTAAIEAKYANDRIELTQKIGDAQRSEAESIRAAFVQAFTSIADTFQGLVSTLSQLSAQSTQGRIDELTDSEQSQTDMLSAQLDQRIISQARYEKEVNNLKEQTNRNIKRLQAEQAEREKKLAVFNATIDAAQTILSVLSSQLDPITKAVVAAIYAAQAAAQVAVIVNTPVPKFAQGTKRVTGGIEGQDSVHALLMPGEKVFSVSRSREYGTALDHIFDKKVASHEINRFVTMSPEARQMALLGAGQAFQSATTLNVLPGSVAARVNTFTSGSTERIHTSTKETVREVMKALSDSTGSDFHELKKAIGKNKKVRIENVDEIASAISVLNPSNNPRQNW